MLFFKYIIYFPLNQVFWNLSVLFSLFQYGASLHENYKTAEKKKVINSSWMNLSTPSSSTSSTPSPTINGSTNPNIPIWFITKNKKQMWRLVLTVLLLQKFYWGVLCFCSSLSQSTESGQQLCSKTPTGTSYSGKINFLLMWQIITNPYYILKGCLCVTSRKKYNIRSLY